MKKLFLLILLLITPVIASSDIDLDKLDLNKYKPFMKEHVRQSTIISKDEIEAFVKHKGLTGDEAIEVQSYIHSSLLEVREVNLQRNNGILSIVFDIFRHTISRPSLRDLILLEEEDPDSISVYAGTFTGIQKRLCIDLANAIWVPAKLPLIRKEYHYADMRKKFDEFMKKSSEKK